MRLKARILGIGDYCIRGSEFTTFVYYTAQKFVVIIKYFEF